MKKILTLATCALMATSLTFAQRTGFKIDKNYVVYTTNDTLTAFTQGSLDDGGDGDNFADDNMMNQAFSTVGFPYTIGGNGNANIHCLTTDYTDPETGAFFSAGYYHVHRSNSVERWANETYGGLTHCKQIIYYYGSGGQGQFSTVVYDTDNNKLTNDPNRKITYQCDGMTWGTPTNFTADNRLKDVTGADSVRSNGHYAYGSNSANMLKFDKIFRIIINFTNASGTDIETGNSDYSRPANSDDNSEFYAKYNFTGPSEDVSYAGFNPENIVYTAFRRSGYLLGVAFISTEADAPTVYMNVSYGMGASWMSQNEGAWGVPFAADGPEQHGYYFSDRYYGDEIPTFGESGGGTGIEMLNKEGVTVTAIYDVYGTQQKELQKGVNVVKYSDGSTEKVFHN